MYSVHVEASRLAVICRQNENAFRAAAERGRETGSNNGEVVMIPEGLIAMERWLDKNLQAKYNLHLTSTKFKTLTAKEFTSEIPNSINSCTSSIP